MTVMPRFSPSHAPIPTRSNPLNTRINTGFNILEASPLQATNMKRSPQVRAPSSGIRADSLAGEFTPATGMAYRPSRNPRGKFQVNFQADTTACLTLGFHTGNPFQHKAGRALPTQFYLNWAEPSPSNSRASAGVAIEGPNASTSPRAFLTSSALLSANSPREM